MPHKRTRWTCPVEKGMIVVLLAQNPGEEMNHREIFTYQVIKYDPTNGDVFLARWTEDDALDFFGTASGSTTRMKEELLRRASVPI